MKINSINIYLDGGTIEIKTNREVYLIDGKMFSNTRGTIFLKHPNDVKNSVAPNQSKLQSKILSAVVKFKKDNKENVFDWLTAIQNLFNAKT